MGLYDMGNVLRLCDLCLLFVEQVPSISLRSSGRYSVCHPSGCGTVLRGATVCLRPATVWEREEEEEEGKRQRKVGCAC